MQRYLHDEVRKKSHLQKNLEQVDKELAYFVYYDFRDEDEMWIYTLECEKWFTIAMNETNDKISNMESEIVTYKSCNVQSDYHNIVIKMENSGNNDMIRESINARIKTNIIENLRMLINISNPVIKSMNDYTALQREYAMTVLNYKLK